MGSAGSRFVTRIDYTAFSSTFMQVKGRKLGPKFSIFKNDVCSF